MRDRPPGEGARGEGGRPGMFAGERGSAAEKREKLWDRGARRVLKLNLVAGPRGRGGVADLNLHPPQPRSNAFVAAPPCCGSTGVGAGRPRSDWENRWENRYGRPWETRQGRPQEIRQRRPWENH